MAEIKVTILDKDLISDLVSTLEELEGDLAKAQEHLDDLKELLRGKVDVVLCHES